MKKKANLKELRSPFSFTTTHRQRDIRECFNGLASDAVGKLVPGAEVFGFTKGQFGLIDLISEVLWQIGPCHITISTWTAAQAEVRAASDFLRSGQFLSMRWIFDYSFLNRLPELCDTILDECGENSVRVTRTHAKFILMRNDKWNIAIRTSMNLNKNPRFENFEISDDPNLAGYLQGVVDEIYTNQKAAEVLKDRFLTVDKQFKQASVNGDVQGAYIGPVDDFDLGSLQDEIDGSLEL